MRRRELPAVAMAGLAATAGGVKLGVDLFSLRSQGYDAFQHLDYCAKLGAKVVHFSEIRFLGSLEDEHVKKVREHATKLGIELELGMRSICPTSKTFDAAQGKAEEQLTRMIRSAKLAGSRIVRCFLGSLDDRRTMPIEQHIENAVTTLRAVRSVAKGEGVMVAVENHAGDMQSAELKSLVEAAGKDFVGVVIDSGNPLWALEDPHLTLETLAPYVLTSHVRDSYLWQTPEGPAIKWVRMGEGNVNIAEWVKTYARLCPGKALQMEIIVIPSRVFRIYDPGFWDAYPKMSAHHLSRYLAFAQKGSPLPPAPQRTKEENLRAEREDLDASYAWTKGILG
jgi:3-oxoisoapionate decarboxylase